MQMQEVSLQRVDKRGLALALALSGMGTWVWNLAAGTVFHAKPGAIAFEPIQVNQQTIRRTLDGPVEDLHEDCILEIQHVRRQILEGVNGPFSFNFGIRTDAHNTRWFLINCSILRDDSGAPIEILGTYKDITLLREDKDRYKSLIDRAPIGVIVSIDDTIVFANRAMKRLLSRTNEEPYINQSLSSLVHPDFRDVQNAHMATLYGDHSDPFPAQYHATNRTYIDVEVVVTRSEWKGCPAHTLFIRDLTVTENDQDRQIKSITELMIRNHDLEQFRKSASHDLSSRLVTIRGYLGELNDEATKKLSKNAIWKFRRLSLAAQQLNQIVATLAKLPKIGSPANQSERVNLYEIADSIRHGALRGIIRDTDAVVRIQNKLRKIKAVTGIRTHISLIFQNLIENAIKFKQANVSPRIEIGIVEMGKIKAVFIKDNGVGIAKRHLELLFEGQLRINKKVQGRGIGLAAVRRMVQLHGGAIWAVSSGANMGSTFYFTLSGL